MCDRDLVGRLAGDVGVGVLETEPNVSHKVYFRQTPLLPTFVRRDTRMTRSPLEFPRVPLPIFHDSPVLLRLYHYWFLSH